MPLQWRHNERDGDSNHRRHCLISRLFRLRSKRTELRVTGLCEGNSPVTGEFPASPVTGEFPAQRASNAENVSIWWCHHVNTGSTVQRIVLITHLVTLCPSMIWVQGWGSLTSSVTLFSEFSALSKHTLAFVYHVYILQVSPQLIRGDTCQIWMWFEESNVYLCHVEIFIYGEINEQGFSNPTPVLALYHTLDEI